MRSLASLFILVAVACKIEPATNPVPRSADQLGVEQGWLVHRHFGFAAPLPKLVVLRGFDEVNKKLAAVTPADQPLSMWSLIADSTHDVLDIVAFNNTATGRDESAFQQFVAGHRTNTRQHGWAVVKDTVVWRSGAHEYFEQTKDTVSKFRGIYRCLASADTRKYPIVVCINAHGPHADRTLGPTVMGLRLMTDYRERAGVR